MTDPHGGLAARRPRRPSARQPPPTPSLTPCKPSPPVVEPEWIEPSPELVELARAHGVAVEYWDQAGSHRRIGRGDDPGGAQALDVDVSTPERIWNALYSTGATRRWRRMLPPVFVTRAGSDNQCWVHVPHGHPVSRLGGPGAGRRGLVPGPGRPLGRAAACGRPAWSGRRRSGSPADLPAGLAHPVGADGGRRRRGPRVVLPAGRHTRPAGPPGAGRGPAVGIHDPGLLDALGALVGDRATWRTWPSWRPGAGDAEGADFVLVNPMHAASPAPPMEPSPYLPVTRRFANPIYLRVEAVEEYASCRWRTGRASRRWRRRLRAAVDRRRS